MNFISRAAPFFVLIGILPWFSASAATHLEIEADPIAYVLDGYSIPAGLAFQRSRIEGGLYGMTVPKGLLENRAFEQSFRGGGVNWDFFGSRFSGFYVGIGTGISHQRYSHTASGESTQQNHYGLSTRVGYRFSGDRFFVSPWIGVSRDFGAREVVLGGERLRNPVYQIFPTVHLGVRF